MRTRGLSLLMVAVMGVAFNARGATPVVTAVAVQETALGGTIVLDSGSKTLVWAPRLGPLVKATVKCLVVTTDKGLIDIPPVRTKVSSKSVWGRASGGGKTYYFYLNSLSASKTKDVQLVTRFDVSKRSSAPTVLCGGSGGGFSAQGVAIYR